jgi:hypothetical protein
MLRVIHKYRFYIGGNNMNFDLSPLFLIPFILVNILVVLTIILVLKNIFTKKK